MPPINQGKAGRVQSSQVYCSKEQKCCSFKDKDKRDNKKASIATAIAEPEEPIRKETKLEKAERIRMESRKEAIRTKNNETNQAINEGKKLIRKDKFEDVFNKEPHRAGRVFKSGNSPL